MDLGRTVCKTTNPLCNVCPINNYCKSYVNKTVNKYPVKLKKNHKPHYNVAIGIIWKNKKLIISKRPIKKLLGGLWEFPGGKIETNETPKECLVREVLEELNIKISVNYLIKKFRYNYSHFSITINAFHCNYIKGTAKALQCDKFLWINPSELNLFAFPSASHKLFNEIKDLQ